MAIKKAIILCTMFLLIISLLITFYFLRSEEIKEIKTFDVGISSLYISSIAYSSFDGKLVFVYRDREPKGEGYEEFINAKLFDENENFLKEINIAPSVEREKGRNDYFQGPAVSFNPINGDFIVIYSENYVIKAKRYDEEGTLIQEISPKGAEKIELNFNPLNGDFIIDSLRYNKEGSLLQEIKTTSANNEPGIINDKKGNVLFGFKLINKTTGELIFDVNKNNYGIRKYICNPKTKECVGAKEGDSYITLTKYNKNGNLVKEKFVNYESPYKRQLLFPKMAYIGKNEFVISYWYTESPNTRARIYNFDLDLIKEINGSEDKSKEGVIADEMNMVYNPQSKKLLFISKFYNMYDSVGTDRQEAMLFKIH